MPDVSTGAAVQPEPMDDIVARRLGLARTRAGRPAGRLVAEVRRLSPQEAVDLALANEPDESPPPGPGRTLTRREAEVAALAGSASKVGRMHTASLTAQVAPVNDLITPGRPAPIRTARCWW
jgi:hypothetical protein